MVHPRPLRAAALALALAGLAVPTAQAREDQPSTLPRVTSSLAGTVSPVDKRSPDAQDAADAARTAAPGVDRRTPDARDAADGVTAARVIATRGPVAPVADNNSDTDWGDVALGAGAAAALLMSLAGTLLLIHRREMARKSRAVTVGR